MDFTKITYILTFITNVLNCIKTGGSKSEEGISKEVEDIVDKAMKE